MNAPFDFFAIQVRRKSSERFGLLKHYRKNFLLIQVLVFGSDSSVGFILCVMY